METMFLSAEKDCNKNIAEQHNWLTEHLMLSDLSYMIPFTLLILNNKRQVVFFNTMLYKISLINSADEILGRRPGELLDCVHSNEGLGCGTTEFCKLCGATLAIVSAQAGRNDVQECRIIRTNFEAIDLRVWAYPIIIKNKSFTFFTLMDISHEKRKVALEKIFFHDVLNTAAGIKGVAEIMQLMEPDQIVEFNKSMLLLSERLIDEIQAQREISLAEKDDLHLTLTDFDLNGVVHEVIKSLELQEIAKNRNLTVLQSPVSISVKSDRVLLRRVISNICKNGLEAIETGEAVTVSMRQDVQNVIINIANPSVMTHDVQLQLFQRSFSTKGIGRGIGSYSIKLLTEKYLKGRVSFVSGTETGTIFTIQLPLLHPASNIAWKNGTNANKKIH